MKRIIYLGLLILLGGCENNPRLAPNKRAVVILTTACGARDTVIMTYFNCLYLYSTSLIDCADRTVAYNVEHFSIIKEEEVKR